jgi:hypothetical protein
MEAKERYFLRCSWYNNIWCYIGFGILGVIGFSLFALIFGWVIMVLWNALMPQIFGFSILSFWQAVGLALLARLLFGCSHKGHYSWRDKHYHRRKYWDDRRSRFYNYKYGSCSHNSDKWKYYEQFWNEEGEKSFNDFVNKKKEENKSE